MNKLLDSFLDLKCPWHNTKISIRNETLFCMKCDAEMFSGGNWNINRINDLLAAAATGAFSQNGIERLKKLKEYYEKQEQTTL